MTRHHGRTKVNGEFILVSKGNGFLEVKNYQDYRTACSNSTVLDERKK